MRNKPADCHYTSFEDGQLPCQSVQTSGTCAYHTALTVRMYWEEARASRKAAKKINLGTVLEFLSPKEVFHRIHSDQGHWPADLLSRVVGQKLGGRRLRVDENFDPKECFNLLKRSSVAIVNIKYTKELKALKNFTFDSTITVDKTQTQSSGHAMSLVGMTFHDDKWWFWIQNWWHKHQFLEMDVDFLRNVKATFTFPETLDQGDRTD